MGPLPARRDPVYRRDLAQQDRDRGKTIVHSIIRYITDRERLRSPWTSPGKKLFMMNEVTRHEIKNIITGLIGCVDMAYTLPVGGERESLNREIKHLIWMIQRQIDFTKEYQEIGIDLPEWQKVRESIPSPDGITVRVSHEITSLEVYADPLLAKIFVYLTENVGRHGVHATEITVSSHHTPHGTLIIFEDNGIGVPDVMKKRIFTRKEGDQKGMGLFLVREILAITGITITETGTYGTLPGSRSGAGERVPHPALTGRTSQRDRRAHRCHRHAIVRLF